MPDGRQIKLTMNFQVSTSKLYQQIMEAAVGFFGLNANDATETDVHAAFDGQKPLAEQLKEAQAANVAEIQKQLDEMKDTATKTNEALTSLQGQFDTMKAENEVKDTRITELQKEIAAAALESETLKKQHSKEVSTLAGELAKTKAGKSMETEEAGDQHDASKERSQGGTDVIVMKSSALSDLVKKRS